LKLKRMLAALAASVGLAAALSVAAPAFAAPNPPTNLVIDQIAQTTVRAQWQAVAGAEQYQLTANGAYAGSATATVETIDGLTCGTEYLIQTKVKVGGVWSALSAPTASGSKTITTASCPPATVPVLLAPFGAGQYQCSVDYPAPNTDCELDIGTGSGNVHLTAGTDGKYTCTISLPGYSDRPCFLTTQG